MDPNLLYNRNERQVIQMAQDLAINTDAEVLQDMYGTLIQPILHTLTVPIQQLYPGLYTLLKHGFIYFELEQLMEHLPDHVKNFMLFEESNLSQSSANEIFDDIQSEGDYAEHLGNILLNALQHKKIKIAKHLMKSEGARLLNREQYDYYNDLIKQSSYADVGMLKDLRRDGVNPDLINNQVYSVRRQKMYLNHYFQERLPDELQNHLYGYLQPEHMRLSHRLYDAPLDTELDMFRPSMFYCSECSFSTANEETLIEHELTH